MEEVRQLVQEEGREARNLVAFHVAVETPVRVPRRPPRALPARRGAPRVGAALRSASAGRDKRSELRARYWALLFGDLQRAIGEIYNTVEVHENLNECQEVILVLENYTRDFKALGEWFRLKWEYDNTPPPQRPQSLAWEIRKTDFVRPESRRTYSVKSSPSVSGKNSPCLSGNNTPSGKNSPVTGKVSPASGKISPRVTHSSGSPKSNLEFFSNKIASKITTKPEPKAAKEPTRLSDIKEKEIKESTEDIEVTNELPKDKVVSGDDKKLKPTVIEIGKAKECANICPKQVVIKSPKHAKANSGTTEKDVSNDELSSQAKATIAKMDAMENAFLATQLNENQARNDNLLNQDLKVTIPHKNNAAEVECDKVSPVNIDDVTSTEVKDSSSTESPVKSEDNFADVSNGSSPNAKEEEPKAVDENKDEAGSTDDKNTINEPEANEESLKVTSDINQDDNEIKLESAKKDNKESTYATDLKGDAKKEQDAKKADGKFTEPKVNSRPAYSQAAAKPKSVVAKPEVKTPVRSTTPIIRNKSVGDVTNTAPKPRQFPKKNLTGKCSYPFNLTTGRTSVFDTTTNAPKVVVKKPPIKIPQLASGDSKSIQSKVDLKKSLKRPVSLKINEKADKKEKSDLTLENNKDCDEYSNCSSDTIVTQIDMSRIESSESLKTLAPDELQMIQDVANSIEVLNVDNSKNDNDGWLTVKSRRLSRESKKQSKSHWANRFHQPSATTSLPTLNMIESPKQESNPIIKASEPAKLDRAKSEQPENLRKPENVVKVTAKPKSLSKLKDPAMIRQKSDVTGLKTHSARNKAKRAEMAKGLVMADGELTKNRLHSSLESLTGLSRSQESTEETFDFDKWKAEFKSTFKYLEDDDQIPNHNEILKTADPSEMSEIAEMTSQIEENERKISWALDFQSDMDQRKLCEEEDLLNRQIMELQQVSDVDMDTETDDTETDAEILCVETNVAVSSCPTPDTLGSLAASLEDQYETALAGMSWAERVDTLVVLEALVARDPGRAQQLHAKLSQGIKRRGSFQDALRRLQAKQARAEQQRLEYQTERAKKIHSLLARVEEVKVAKNQLIEEKRLRMERRLQKAAENRDQHLKDIVRKAHDEEEKLREIAFIKQLEAENRRHDFLDQCRSHTMRLRIMRRDRLDKLEQKAAREAAVGARRRALEAARGLRAAALLQRRRERDARVSSLRGLRDQQRDRAAREKAEGVKSRLSALAAAAELDAAALRSRIRDKQDASQQRLESHLQAIREKATGPRQATTSESQDQTAKEEREMQEEVERMEQDRKDREKQKVIKKKARKIKQKLLSTGDDTAPFDDHAVLDIFQPTANRLYKVINQISNIITPLLDSEPDHRQNDDKKTNKILNGNGDTNGDVKHIEVTGKKKKKQKSEDKSKESTPDNTDAVNNNTPEIIVNDVQQHTEEKTEVGKKKNKKNRKDDKNGIDKPKLSKTNSVCSSLSDMSKASSKGEKKAVVLDMPLLEKQLNELQRLMDKYDKVSKEKSMPQRAHALRVLGRVLAVAAERRDLAAQFTHKALGAALRGAARAAAGALAGGAAPHLVTLLAHQLEKDIQADVREMELTRQLTDCLSVCLDAALCAGRLHAQRRDAPARPPALVALRARAHTLITYLCLCGCIQRAEGAGEARESMQTLLTVCADLCQPSPLDVGSERASAAQSLRNALGTSLCGSRAEFCMLFAKEADIEHCGGFVRAARTAHLLRALAELDHHIVQEAFGEAGWPLEFRAAVSRLLAQHAPNDREAPRTAALRLNNQRLDQTLAETMVLDLIVLVGFVVVNNPAIQETICDGWNVIKMLCTLPANWLVSKSHSHSLLPTLLALAERPAVAAVIAADLSMEMLDEYLESPDAQKIKLVQIIKQGRAKKTTGKK